MFPGLSIGDLAKAGELIKQAAAQMNTIHAVVLQTQSDVISIKERVVSIEQRVVRMESEIEIELGFNEVENHG